MKMSSGEPRHSPHPAFRQIPGRVLVGRRTGHGCLRRLSRGSKQVGYLILTEENMCHPESLP